MRFMVMVKANEKSEAGVLPDEKLLAEMGRYNEGLIKAGALLDASGLKASSHGARVRLTRKGFTVKDGPFAEAKELVGGYWLLAAESREALIETLGRVPLDEVEMEIREVYEMSDFAVDPSEQPGGWRDQEQRFREATEGAAGAPPAPPARKPGTTRFIAMLKSDRKTESGEVHDPKVLEAMGALMNELAAAGALLGGEGLKPSARGAKLRLAKGRRTVVDGPFTETKELIAGYTMIQVPSKAEAVDFAKRWLEIHVGSDLEEGEIEIRPLLEPEDFSRRGS
jgi:hypothetical protein